MRLERGQVAAITGGASGIGLGMAHAFADRGLDVVIADISDDALGAAVAELEAKGVGALGVRTDVRDLDQVRALADATLERFGRVDVVCNNAGVVSAGVPIWEVPKEDWDWVVGVDLDGIVNGIRAFVPHLVAQNRGHVVNTSSMAGLLPQPTAGAYVASKFAVVGISETLAMEFELFAPEVGVTVVCPGVVDTDILSSGRDVPSEIRMAELHRQLTESDEGFENKVAGDGGIVDPSEVAAAVVDAIETRRLHIAPNGAPAAVAERSARLQADIAPS